MANYERPEWTSLSGSAHDNMPGRYNEVIPVTTTLICTGSAWGVGAVLVATSATGGITGSNGLAIDAADISGHGIIEFGPIEINATSGTIYALKRNHGVI